MLQKMRSSRSLFRAFFPFWGFLFFFKIGAILHFALLVPLGEKLFPVWVVGILVGAGAFVQMLLDVPAGHLLDRFGYRRLLICTTCFFALAGISLLLPLQMWTYLFTIVFSTAGWFFLGPGVDAYILSHSQISTAGRFMSLRDSTESFGGMIATAIFALVLTLSLWQIGLIIFFPFLFALFFIHMSPKDQVFVKEKHDLPNHHVHVRRHHIKKTLNILKELNPASFMLVITGFASCVFYSIIWFVLPLVVADQTGFGWVTFGLGIFDLGIVLFGFILGRLVDSGNKRTLVFFGLLLFSVFGALLGFHLNWFFVLFGFLATVGDEISHLSLWSWLHSLDHEHLHDGLIAGVIKIFRDFGWAIGPVLAGLLYPTIGATWTITVGAVCVSFSWVIYQFFGKKQPAMCAGDIPCKPHTFRHRR